MVHVARLSLTNFRSYADAVIAPGAGLVVLTGENGAGKDSGWESQRRDDGSLPFSSLLRSYGGLTFLGVRSEEHTSELQSLMRSSYAVFCLKKKTKITITIYHII